jgi:hypothetical protein
VPAVLAFSSPDAFALDCAQINGTPSGDDCTLDATYECTGATVVDILGNLTITSTGEILCGSDDLTLNVGGDFTLEAGGEISANGADGTNGSTGSNGTGGAAGASGQAADGQACTGGMPGQPGGTGSAGGACTDATSAGDIAITYAGAGSIAGTISTDGAQGGNGGAGGMGGIGGSGGPGGPGGATFPPGCDGALGGAGGAGGAGSTGCTCSAGGSITINAQLPGDLDLAGTLRADGGDGSNGGPGGDGGLGGPGGSGGAGGAGVTATGGDGSNGGAGGNAGGSQLGTPGCLGGAIALNVDLVLGPTAEISADGGDGGDGASGVDGGQGGAGGSGGTSNAAAGGDGGDGGLGGICSSGANGGAGEDGGDFTIASAGPVDIDATIEALGGSGGSGGAAGTNGAGGGAGAQGNGNPAGNPGTAGDPGNGVCTLGSTGADADNADASVVIDACDDAEVDTTGAIINPPADVNEVTALCKLCAITIVKSVAPDIGCDGTADDPPGFGQQTTVPVDDCVVYQICVTNTGNEAIENVTVDDPDIGISGLDFGDLAPMGETGDEVCLEVPGDSTATACVGLGDTCICQDMPAENTSSVATATCAQTQDNACDQTNSNCDDTAEVACTSGGCLTRTPGFWCNRPLATKYIIDSDGLMPCGIELTNVTPMTDGSAIENLPGVGDHRCVEDIKPQHLQLLRQCTAAALNIQATELADGDCTTEFSDPVLGDIGEIYDTCCTSQDFCTGVSGTNGQRAACIGVLDEFNNEMFGGNELDFPSDFPTSNGEGEPGWFPPGRADAMSCREANGNGWTNFGSGPCPGNK